VLLRLNIPFLEDALWGASVLSNQISLHRITQNDVPTALRTISFLVNEVKSEVIAALAFVEEVLKLNVIHLYISSCYTISTK